jgi:hypothetical protein
VTRALVVVALFVAGLCAPRLAHAVGPTAALAEAQAHFAAGEYAEVAPLAEPITQDETLPRADRAEAWRLIGLSYFFLGRADDADRALVEFLKLEPDAHLDPSLVPPDGVAFFEGVRARHAGELRRYRPRPKRSSVVVALIPPAGQFENGQKAKGWALGVTEGLLLATNVTTYFILKDMCNANDGTCGDACDPSKESCASKDATATARTLQTVNLASGVLLIGVVVYGSIDGYLGWKKEGERLEGLSVAPTQGGATVGYSGSF